MNKFSHAAAVMLFILLFSFCAPLSAADVSLGATVWYAGWDPVFKNLILMKNDDGQGATNTSIKTDPAFLIGPVISVSFLDRFNFAAVCTVGKFYGKGSLDLHPINAPPPFPIFASPTYNALKIDFDSTLNYSLFKYMKIFAGLKYQSYSTSIFFPVYNANTNVSIGRFAIDSSSNGIGPGAGIALSYPLADSLFIIWNGSGVYMRASNQYTIKNNLDTHAEDEIESSKDQYNIYGANTTLSLAYYFASSRVTVSLGGRYQYLLYKKASGKDIYNMNGQADKFYGITLSVLYTL